MRKLLPLSLIFASFYPSICLALSLSPGDRLQVSIPNEKYFAGVYEVNQDGNLEIPYIGLFPVKGLEPEEIQTRLHQTLINQGYFLEDKLQLSVEMIRWAPVEVTLRGELFQPGRVLINEQESGEITVPLETRPITGNFPIARYLTDAIRAAGGVLPTADVSQIQVLREEQTITVDLTGVFTGETVDDIPLVAGDQIIVPHKGKAQPELVRPSQITPPGIKVFISNLTVPATSNATSAVGNEREGITFPYGARFGQAAFSANCVGGTDSTNADRRIILIRVDRLTGETHVLERKVEELLKKSENDEDNPFLMPRDGVACYDSSVTNTRDIFRTIADIFSPFIPLINLRNLFR